MSEHCRGSHDGKHKPILLMGGLVCKCCRRIIKSIINMSTEEIHSYGGRTK